MAAGGWVVLGTLVGTLGSILTTWLAAYLNREKLDVWDVKAMKLLETMLNNHQWCELKALANIIGLDESTTREYLILLGARGSRIDGKKWGLASKNPLTQDDAD